MSAKAYEGSIQAHDVVLESGIDVTARDGITLATDLYRPASGGEALEGEFPTVLLRTPYDRARAPMALAGRFFASRGYVFAAQDTRGRFDSGGEFAFLFNEHHEGSRRLRRGRVDRRAALVERQGRHDWPLVRGRRYSRRWASRDRHI